MQLLQECQLLEAIAIAEDVSWNAAKPLDAQLAQAVFQFNAARRALSLANQLQSPESRKKHKSRIMSMLNKLRSSLLRLHEAIAGEIEAMQQES